MYGVIERGCWPNVLVLDLFGDGRPLLWAEQGRKRRAGQTTNVGAYVDASWVAVSIILQHQINSAWSAVMCCGVLWHALV